MTRDILTVMWKEWKELLWAGGLLRGGRVSLLIMLAIFGVFLPYQTGRAWVESAAPLFYWAWLPLMLVAGVVADSFAGERERHTLETLLASRLPDRAILVGKLAAAVTYGWGLVLAMLGLSLVTVNVAELGEACCCSRRTSRSGRRFWPCWARGLPRPRACSCRYGPRPSARRRSP